MHQSLVVPELRSTNPIMSSFIPLLLWCKQGPLGHWTLMNVSCSQVYMEASLGKFNQKVSMKVQFGIRTMSETLCTHATSKSVSR